MRWTALITVCLFCGALNAEPLQYKFKEGQKLSYHTAGDFKYENGSHETTGDMEIYVVSRNADGSHRLLGVSQSTFKTSNGPAPEKPDVSVSIANVTAEGAITYIGDQARVGFDSFLPALPKNGETSWSAPGQFGAMMQYAAVTAQPADAFEFTATRSSPEDKIYVSTNTGTVHFDHARGFVTSSKMQYTQGYGFNGKGNATMELRQLTEIPADDLAQLQKDLTVYQQAREAYRGLFKEAGKDETRYAAALGALKSAEGTIATPALKTVLADMIEQHETSVGYEKEEAQRQAALLNKPAPEWELNDMDGKKVSLKSLAGKVVVLDFWYRGCGWCIRAMPQINQLAEDFKDQPVAILGMNTDSDIKDAQFVIEAMQLKYPTLRTDHAMAQKFGVQGFPTLVIIDQKGNLVDFHVGYAPDLRETVGKQIRELLANRK